MRVKGNSGRKVLFICLCCDSPQNFPRTVNFMSSNRACGFYRYFFRQPDLRLNSSLYTLMYELSRVRSMI